MNRKSKIIVSIICILLVLLILLGLTYGYYLTKINGNTNDKSISINMADLELTYDDVDGLIEAPNILPGDVITKSFTVKNTGNTKINDYAVYLSDVVNTFEDKDDLNLTLTCTSDKGNCKGTNIIYPKDDLILITNDIEQGELQSYELKVEFIETNDDQSDNMDKIISGNILIKDLKELGNKVVNNDGADSATIDNSKLLSNYRIYGNSLQGDISFDYQQLETISATQPNSNPRTAGFNTGYKWKEVSKIEVTMQFLNTPTNGSMIFKSITSSASDSASPYISSGTNNVYFNGITGSVTTDYTREELTNNGLKTLEINIDSNESEYYIYFGAWNDAAYSANWQLKSLKIYNLNNNLVRDWVPCYRKSDNVIGIYDRIHDYFQSNKGTGTLKKGVTLPTPNEPLTISSVGDLVTDTTDEHYGKYKIPVITSGNLYNIETQGAPYKGQVQDNKIITSGCTATYITTYQYLSNYLGKTVTISFDLTTSEDGTFLIYQYQSNGIGVDFSDPHPSMVAGKKKKIVVTGVVKELPNKNPNYSKGAIAIYKSGYAGTYTIENIQFEFGEEATDYKPYSEPNITNIYLDEPLRKVGEFADYIDFKTKSVVRNVGVYDLQNITFNITSSVYVGQKTLPFQVNSAVGLSTNYLLSTHFINAYNDYGGGKATNHLMVWNKNSIRVQGYGNENFTSGSILKQFMQEQANIGKPVLLYYPLSTETKEEIEVGNINIENASSFAVNTSINTSKIELDYIK